MARTKYYHVDEVAELIGLTANEVRDMLKRNELKGHKLGRRWLINMDQPYFEYITCKNAEKEYKFGEQAERAMTLVEQGESLFITGKAGTGKTTLLKELLKRNETGLKKNVVTLAPTGVAAENAGGMTIHHFFQFSKGFYLPGHEIRPNLYNLNPDKEFLVRSLDMLVIDEISMVRCDLLDAMDDILRHYRRNDKPFGGVQVVMLGDLYQLSPIVHEEEWEEMNKYYQSAYFFCSGALRKMNYKVVELTKIYRQNDSCFVKLLNNIRVADVNREDLAELDARCQPNFKPKVDDDVVTLMTHNRKSDKWNKEMFSLLNGESIEYMASTKGWFAKPYPAEYHLQLKKGARVMFLRNTDSYKNGTMGRVVSLDRDSVWVRKDDGGTVQVTKATWKQSKYIVDKKSKTIHAIESGSYTQYPLKLAWAVSIHKSQGLTFDEVAIDASKAFAPGQVYVALSRCRTLEGIHLLSQITYQKIMADNVVKEYLSHIDTDGNVSLPDGFEPIKYESNPLVINVSKRKFLKLEAGEMITYKHAIDAVNKEQLFVHERGVMCISKVFKDVKQVWSLSDTNNGHCPFIQRQYKNVIFECADLQRKLDAEIEGYIEVYLNSDNHWAYKFRIFKVGKATFFEKSQK